MNNLIKHLNIEQKRQLSLLDTEISKLQNQRTMLLKDFEERITLFSPPTVSPFLVPQMQFTAVDHRKRISYSNIFTNFQPNLGSRFDFGASEQRYSISSELKEMTGYSIIESFHITKGYYCEEMYCTAVHLDFLQQEQGRSFLYNGKTVVLGFCPNLQGEIFLFYISFTNEIPEFNFMNLAVRIEGPVVVLLKEDFLISL